MFAFSESKVIEMPYVSYKNFFLGSFMLYSIIFAGPLFLVTSACADWKALTLEPDVVVFRFLTAPPATAFNITPALTKGCCDEVAMISKGLLGRFSAYRQ